MLICCWWQGASKFSNIYYFSRGQLLLIQFNMLRYTIVRSGKIFHGLWLIICWSSEGSHLESKFCSLSLSSEHEFNTQFYTVQPSFVHACTQLEVSSMQINSPISHYYHWIHWKDRADCSRRECPIQGPTCGSCFLLSIDDDLFVFCS